MSASDITKGKAWEDGGVTLLARIYGNAGTAITQASLTAITCKVFDLDGTTPDTALSTPTVTIASTVFDTLQTSDPRWSTDTTGFNFLHALADTTFPSGDHRYRVEYTFDPVSGSNFIVVFEVYAQAIRSS